MVRKLAVLAIVLGAAGLAVFWFLTMPRTVAATELPEREANLANGERMFWAGGCDSCHAAAGAEGPAQMELGGGQSLKTRFGTFVVPNISPDPEHGIGQWSLVEFVNAMKYGVGRNGEHLYPSFPYPYYQRMSLEDIVDLKAFLDTLPPVAKPSEPHLVPFPYNIRRGIGLWKILYADGKAFTPDPAKSEKLNLGQYLVDGPGHCGACHTPRNFIGGPTAGAYLAGGPAPEGQGRIPNITPGALDWSEEDIAAMLETGFTPDFDSVGGTMGAVVLNTAKLTAEERAAMAAYLKTVPPVAPTP